MYYLNREGKNSRVDMYVNTLLKGIIKNSRYTSSTFNLLLSRKQERLFLPEKPSLSYLT